MPTDAQLKVTNTLHRALVKVTGGRFGWHMAKMPVLELTTIGRKTGLPRTVMLTSPVRDGSAIVVVASRGGDPTHPAWFTNLVANPKVEVSWQGKPKEPRRARVATAEERNRLWPLVTTASHVYAGYQEKTSREIPLVLLEPVT
jgi:deazaflavin-dependent oxidoreductase (nitroreductase family)